MFSKEISELRGAVRDVCLFFKNLTPMPKTIKVPEDRNMPLGIYKVGKINGIQIKGANYSVDDNGLIKFNDELAGLLENSIIYDINFIQNRGENEDFSNETLKDLSVRCIENKIYTLTEVAYLSILGSVHRLDNDKQIGTVTYGEGNYINQI